MYYKIAYLYPILRIMFLHRYIELQNNVVTIVILG